MSEQYHEGLVEFWDLERETGRSRDAWIEWMEAEVRLWSTPFKAGSPGRTPTGFLMASLVGEIMRSQRRGHIGDGNVRTALIISYILGTWAKWVLRKKSADPGYPAEEREYKARVAELLPF